MATSTPLSTVLVFDFGAQYGQLIARRVRDLNVYSEIVPCDISADEVREMNACCASSLSGGPASVYAEDAPSIDPAIFDLGLPVLGLLLRPADHGRDARRHGRPHRGGRVRPAPPCDARRRVRHAAVTGDTPHGADRVDEPSRRRDRGARGLHRYRQSPTCARLPPWSAPSASFTPRSSTPRSGTCRIRSSSC